MISIIVPVHNVVSLLPAAVDSVLCQTYSDWELILVDDGSDDGSSALCDQYASSDSRIRVIHQENGGPSAARNTGLGVATGEYLQFLDSDDWLSPEALEVLLQTITDFGVDMVVFDAQCEWGDHSMHEKSHIPPGIYDSEIILEKLSIPSLPPYVWNKFCLRSLYDGVLFPAGEKWEDVPTVIHPVSRAGRIAVINRPLYHYRQRYDSITKQATQDGSSIKWRFLQYAKRYEFLKSNYPHIAKVARSSLIIAGMNYYSFCLRGRDQRAERRRVLRFLRLPEMGQELPDAKTRMIRRIFCAFPRLSAVLLRLRKKFR